MTSALVAAATAGYLYGHRTSTSTAGSAPSPSGPYQLTAPQSVLGGAFIVDPDTTVPASPTAVRDYADDGVTNPTPVSISYKSGSSASRESIQLDGAWGTISDPEQAIDRQFAASTRNPTSNPTLHSELVGPRQTMHPTGLGDAVMKCQNFRLDVKQTPTITPICIWADHYTLGQVTVYDPEALRHGGTGVSLGENADTAARIRNDARTPR
ncbi:hypothetical protein AB0G73_22205 [Streptomyces sp. NPDC020719]|uniref:hypothetical protein n=1 Tax=Streptomyces sp. NPDC020719 TaxID=3154896 RepID=UPI0033E2294F